MRSGKKKSVEKKKYAVEWVQNLCFNEYKTFALACSPSLECELKTEWIILHLGKKKGQGGDVQLYNFSYSLFLHTERKGEIFL